VRLRHVLERVMNDPLAAGFMDPVDTDYYSDYLDIVDEPWCLLDVLQKLENGEYKGVAYPKFLSDIRKIWRNCKVYNLFQSQIWYSAHALAMLSDRLYQAWVMSFQEGLIALDNDMGQPWAERCRVCVQDGRDDKIILCDHCDGQFHIDCLRPRLKSIPDGIWLCARCDGWLKRTGAHVLSATAEDEIRELAANVNRKEPKLTLIKKYLVKWRGLSYSECTWELPEDMADDSLALSFHKLNDSPPAEPPLTQAEIGIELAKDKKAQPYPAMYQASNKEDTIAAVYAQMRALHFIKWERPVPEALLRECGAPLYAFSLGMRDPMRLPNKVIHGLDICSEARGKAALGRVFSAEASASTAVGNGRTASDVAAILDGEGEDDDEEIKMEDKDKGMGWFRHPGQSEVRDEVTSCLADVVYHVAKGSLPAPEPARRPLNSYEYEICLPKAHNRLFMDLGEYKNLPFVLDWDRSNATPGPAQVCGRIKRGDIIIGVDGQYTVQMPFAEVVRLLGSARAPYIYIRFLRISQEYQRDPFLGPDRILPTVSKRPPLRRSRFVGVVPAPGNAWTAEAQVNFARIVRGPFGSEEEAARAYDDMCCEVGDEGGVRGGYTRPRNWLDGARTTRTSVSLALQTGVEDELAAYGELEHLYVYGADPNDDGMSDSDSSVSDAGDAFVAAEKKKNKKKEAQAEAQAVAQAQAQAQQAATVEMDVDVDGDGADDADDEHEEPAVSLEQRRKDRAFLAGDNEKERTDYDAVDESTLAAHEVAEDEGETKPHVPDDVNSLDSQDSDSDLDGSDSSDSDSDPEKSASDGEWDVKDEDDAAEYKPNKLVESDGALGRLLRAVNQSVYPPTRSEWDQYILESARQDDNFKQVRSSFSSFVLYQADRHRHRRRLSRPWF